MTSNKTTNNMMTYTIYDDVNLVHVVTRGTVSSSEMLNLFQQIMSDPNYRTTMNCCWDASQLEVLQGSVLDINSAAQLINDPNRYSKPTRTAIMLNSENESIEKHVRGFLLMASASNIEHRIFKDIDDPLLLPFLQLDAWPWYD